MGTITIPYFFGALIAIEYGYNWARRRPYQTARDSATSLLAAVPHFVLLSIAPVVWVVLYALLWERVPWQMDLAWWTFPLGVLVMDLATYWMHRYHHAINLTWGVHSVHHSSEEFTLTTGARSSVAEPLVNVLSGAYLFLVVPAVIGLPLPAAAFGYLVKDCWGFAVHTRNIDKLGFLEAFLATPSHHRVHHAMNPIYAGKNFGFVFIVWDKLFGTFQPELASEPPVFGVSRAPRSFNPVVASFHELRMLWRDARATRRLRDKLRLWYMPAGWRPADVTGGEDLPWEKYAPLPARGATLVTAAHLAYLTFVSLHLQLTLPDHSAAANLLYLGYFMLGTLCCGYAFDGDRRYAAAECARVVITGAAAAFGSWFGRAVDPIVALIIAGNAVVIIVALAVRLRPTMRPTS